MAFGALEFRRVYEQRRFIQETAMAIRRLWEKGQDRRAPRFETLHRIGEALGRRVEVVFAEQKRKAPMVLVA